MLRIRRFDLDFSHLSDFGKRSDFIFALLLLIPAGITVLAVSYPWSSPLTLLDDPFAISHNGPIHPLMGSISTIGGCLFLCTAAVTLFGATFVDRPFLKYFLVFAGLYSSLLGSDDLFSLHDEVFPGDFGIHERVLKVFYLGAQIIYLGLFWRLLLELNFLILGGSLFFFALSWVFDSPHLSAIVMAVSSRLGYMGFSDAANLQAWEDLPKLLGITLWLWFHALSTSRILRDTFAQKSDQTLLPR